MKSFKKHIIGVGIIVVCMSTINLNAQESIGTNNPDPSSALDVTSKTAGFLMPRMTSAERIAIVSPAAGLEVYDTTTQSHWYYDGTVWVQNTAGGDITDDAWVNNPAGRVELGTQSDGTTARTTGTEFVALDNGNVGIGTITPRLNLEVQGDIALSKTTPSTLVSLRYDEDDRFLLGAQSLSTFNAAGGANIQAIGNSFTTVGSLEAGDIVLTHGTPAGPAGATSGMHIKNTTGFVGIGTATPATRLEVVGSMTLSTTGTNNSSSVRYLSDDRFLIGSSNLSTFNATGGANIQIIGNSFTPIAALEPGDIVLTHGSPGGTAGAVQGIQIKNTTGFVGIGTRTPSERLHVIGNILASGTITPDYVFQSYFDGQSSLKPEYRMLSLEEVEAFASVNKHLPGVPSAEEVEDKGGILVNRATEINLEKIEELFLHAIEQNKQIKLLEEENALLKQRLENIEKTLGIQD